MSLYSSHYYLSIIRGLPKPELLTLLFMHCQFGLFTNVYVSEIRTESSPPCFHQNKIESEDFTYNILYSSKSFRSAVLQKIQPIRSKTLPMTTIFLPNQEEIRFICRESHKHNFYKGTNHLDMRFHQRKFQNQRLSGLSLCRSPFILL